MTNDDVSAVFERIDVGDVIRREDWGESSRWSFQASGFPMFVQTQEPADRIRIVAQIGRAEDLNVSLLELMDANYRTAMDARYALAGEHVVSAFLHPLNELTREALLDGLLQVIGCAETCGTENSGGRWMYGSPDGLRSSAKAGLDRRDHAQILAEKLRRRERPSGIVDLRHATLNVNVVQGQTQQAQVIQSAGGQEVSNNTLQVDSARAMELAQEIRESVDRLGLSQSDRQELLSELAKITPQGRRTPRQQAASVESGLASVKRILESAGGSAAGSLLVELTRLLGG